MFHRLVLQISPMHIHSLDLLEICPADDQGCVVMLLVYLRSAKFSCGNTKEESSCCTNIQRREEGIAELVRKALEYGMCSRSYKGCRREHDCSRNESVSNVWWITHS